MPATAAHFQFGQRVFDLLPDPIKILILIDKGTFDLGLQGPDLLFFHNPLKHNRILNLGNAIHERPAQAFFEPALRKAFYDPKVLIYLLGCACHYALDSTCHPFINKTFPTLILHRQAETDLDARIIQDYGLAGKIHTYIPRHVCVGAVAQAYSGMLIKDIARTLGHMRLFSRLLERRKLIAFTENLIGKKGVLSSLSIGNGNHFPNETTHLRTLFDQAIPKAQALIVQLYDDYENKTVHMENFKLNFEGARK